MTKHLTLRQMAELIGKIESRSAEETDRLHQQMRGWQQRGQFLPVSTEREAANSAGLYDEIALCHAAFLSRLHDHGFDGRMLKMATDAANASNLRPTALDRPVQSGLLAEAIRGSLRGEHWSYVLVLKRNLKTGEKRLQGRFAYSEERPESDAVNRIVMARDKAHGLTSLAITVIPVSDLFRELLSAA